MAISPTSESVEDTLAAISVREVWTFAQLAEPLRLLTIDASIFSAVSFAAAALR